jgi:hypothetical protein
MPADFLSPGHSRYAFVGFRGPQEEASVLAHAWCRLRLVARLSSRIFYLRGPGKRSLSGGASKLNSW